MYIFQSKLLVTTTSTCKNKWEPIRRSSSSKLVQISRWKPSKIPIYLGVTVTPQWRSRSRALSRCECTLMNTHWYRYIYRCSYGCVAKINIPWPWPWPCAFICIKIVLRFVLYWDHTHWVLRVRHMPLYLGCWKLGSKDLENPTISAVTRWGHVACVSMEEIHWWAAEHDEHFWLWYFMHEDHFIKNSAQVFGALVSALVVHFPSGWLANVNTPSLCDCDHDMRSRSRSRSRGIYFGNVFCGTE
jgi:hypothetical protein